MEFSEFNLAALACWLSTNLLGCSQNAWYLFRLGVVSLFIVAVAAIDRCQVASLSPMRQAVLLYGLFAFCIILCWLPNFARPHINPDEAQWIATANNFVREPWMFIRHFAASNTTREMTILPLVAGSYICSGALGYSGARTIGALLWAAFAVLYYLIVVSAFGRQIGLWSACVIVILLSLLSCWDYVAYNSELPALVLCAASLALFLCAERCRHSSSCLAASGVFLALAPLAKTQAVPLSVALGAVIVVTLLARRDFRAAACVVGGGIVTAVCVVTAYTAAGILNEVLFVQGSLREYATQGLLQADRGWLRRTLNVREFLVRDELRPLFLGAGAVMPFVLYSRFEASAAWSPKQSFVLWSGLACLAGALFAVWFPAHAFHHYALLLVLPCGLILASALHLAIGSERRSSWAIAFVVFLVFLFVFYKKDGHEGVRDLALNCGSESRSAMSSRMLELTVPGDRLLVWGWWPAYFVETGLLQGSRWMYPVFLAGGYESAGANVRRYLEDLRVLQPKLIVEWIGEDAIHFKDPEVFGLRAVPEINEYVMANYELVETNGNQKLFLRKD
jgi:hypothetical protein